MPRRPKRRGDGFFRPKCYPVVIPTEREQLAFETMAEFQKAPNVGAWLFRLGSLFIDFYHERNLLPEELAKWIAEADACK